MVIPTWTTRARNTCSPVPPLPIRTHRQANRRAGKNAPRPPRPARSATSTTTAAAVTSTSTTPSGTSNSREGDERGQRGAALPARVAAWPVGPFGSQARRREGRASEGRPRTARGAGKRGGAAPDRRQPRQKGAGAQLPARQDVVRRIGP